MALNLTGQLEIDVDEASLPRARKQIEQGLADIEIGTSGSGVSGQLSRDVSAADDSGIDDAVQLEQLSVLEEIRDAVEKRALSTGGGGGGGAPGAGGSLLGIGLLSRLRGGGGGRLVSAGRGAASRAAGLARRVGPRALRRGAPSVLFSDQFGVRGIGQDGEGIGPGASRLSSAAEDLGRDLGLPDLGDREIDLSVPSFLQDLSLGVPDFLEDVDLSVPPFLQDLSVGVPDVLADPPQIGFDVPPALQDLFGGGGAGPTEPTGPGSGVDLSTGFPGQGGQSGGFDISLDDIGFDIDVGVQQIQRDIERAIEEEFRAASIRRDIQDLIQDQLQREFVP